MKKPTFSDAMAGQARNSEPGAAEAKEKPSDGRMNTTLRISPEGLRALKNVAADKRVRVNDLVLEGVEYVLALNGKKMQLRK